jgi:hypothetical protein
MNRFQGLLILTVVLNGCAAEMMETHGDKVTLLKVGDYKSGKGGVVRYLNTGLTSWKNARRSDAEKQMERFCKGPYKIVEEGPRSKFGSSMPTESHATLEVDQYTYIRYECPKK